MKKRSLAPSTRCSVFFVIQQEITCLRQMTIDWYARDRTRRTISPPFVTLKSAEGARTLERGSHLRQIVPQGLWCFPNRTKREEKQWKKNKGTFSCGRGLYMRLLNRYTLCRKQRRRRATSGRLSFCADRAQSTTPTRGSDSIGCQGHVDIYFYIQISRTEGLCRPDNKG
ncbi:uncharacterized protein LOC143184949 [Calliopsis andreniformis]|uniref:uncharacterized protein LOC143184949 n=1 Tax=Calliopsis andreniformis TaxID=337506 RepID=UPI003FCC306A